VSDQLALFDNSLPAPEGLHYTADFVSAAVEQELISAISALPLQPFQFGAFEGKRRVASFGFRYDYTLRQLQQAEPVPVWLAEAIERVETWEARQPEFGRFSVPNTMWVSVSAGTAINRISTGSLGFRSAPPANFVSAGPPASLGSVTPSMPNVGRST
jgi:hypothetical protein